jgi:lipopolysaccharide/colanic/teichoic acid biosynthesis glycosyltransferase
MSPNTSVFFIVFAITLSLLITSIIFTTSAMASSKGGGSVAQEQVRTGNSSLDKEINKFYSCIYKTHQDPPSIEKVDNCYSQALGGSGIAGGTIDSGVTGADTSPTTSHHHHNK